MMLLRSVPVIHEFFCIELCFLLNQGVDLRRVLELENPSFSTESHPEIAVEY